MRPIIGLTCSFGMTGGERPRLQTYLYAAYTDAVFAAGGLPRPLPLPPRYDEALLDELLADCDGLLFTGGHDIDPRRYGQAPHPRTETLHPRREAFELDLFRRADGRRVPMLAICLGHQVAHVARGGRLVQHVDDLERRTPIRHHDSGRDGSCHDVSIAPGSHLARIVGGERIEVNSRHHQVVDSGCPGRGLRTVALSADGIIEASEDMDGRFLLTVQWHPEDLIDRREHLALFAALVAAAGGATRQRRTGGQRGKPSDVSC